MQELLYMPLTYPLAFLGEHRSTPGAVHRPDVDRNRLCVGESRRELEFTSPLYTPSCPLTHA